MILTSALVSAYLTYTFGIKGAMKQRIATEQIKLYMRAITYVQDLPDRSKDHTEENLAKLASEFQSIYNELLLVAPDNVINAFIDAIGQVKKGASVQPLTELVIILRKEVIPTTKIQGSDIVSVEFRA